MLSYAVTSYPMLENLLLIFLIGLMQGAENICGSAAMRKSCHPLDYGFYSNLIASVILGVYFVIKNFFLESSILSQTASQTDFVRNLLIMILGGVVSCVAVVANLSAMKLGHVGITNGIYQSSFALNFLLMVIFFKSDASVVNYIAVSVMLIGVFLMAMQRDENGKFNWKWCAMCAVAFLFNALGQFVTTIPSQYNYADAMDIRGISILAAMTVCYGISKKAAHVETNPAVKMPALWGGLVFAGVQLATYPVLDKLALTNSVHLFTPIMLMTVTILFSLYSRFFLKERFSVLQYSGLACCLIGILLFVI